MSTMTTDETIVDDEEVQDQEQDTEAPEERPKRRVAKKATGKKRGRKPGYKMSSSHKDALAVGRREGAAVRAYLEAIAHEVPRKGRRGRKPMMESPEQMQRRLSVIDATMPKADVLHRLQLIQERLELTNRLDSMHGKISDADMDVLEERFVRHAKSYAERKDISYRAFREVGVPASVLKRAGIARNE